VDDVGLAVSVMGPAFRISANHSGVAEDNADRKATSGQQLLALPLPKLCGKIDDVGIGYWVRFGRNNMVLRMRLARSDQGKADHHNDQRVPRP
jgi:hypothetical protein